ncbi:MAG TPA: cohesin domain-containing protein [Candidatus Avimonas sp.]|jgi:hypothetical protein|nr:cohesin domain-containing protein [Candidatus Avimonas sp.]HQA15496.1 cohesin domain-containing protein [Candidatus Avimonas sp.]HQD37526.1 cohesin domain-containing protein [Candidatus Avimonas sp.]
MNLKNLISQSISQNFAAREKTLDLILDGAKSGEERARSRGVRPVLRWVRRPVAIAATLAVVMVGSVITLIAQSSQKTTNLQLTPTIGEGGATTALPGDTVTLKVSTLSQTGFKKGVVGLTLDILYDDDVFGYVNETIDKKMSNSEKFVAATNEATPGEITVLIYADAYEEEIQSTLAYIGDGDIFSLTFTVKEDAEPGDYSFTVQDYELADYTDDEGGFELVTVTPQPATVTVAKSTVISVDVTWGSMQFTYNVVDWNPDTHQYEGGWTCDEDNNKITVTNNSNIAIDVTCEYTKAQDYDWINGSFTVDGQTPTFPFTLDELEEGGTPDSRDVYLTLESEKPDEEIQGQLGTVTVSIDEHQPEQ